MRPLSAASRCVDDHRRHLKRTNNDAGDTFHVSAAACSMAATGSL
jgi:hypothetical protein